MSLAAKKKKKQVHGERGGGTSGGNCACRQREARTSLFFKKLIYFIYFLERGKGREKGRKQKYGMRNIN